MRGITPTSAQEEINFCGTHVKWGDVPMGYDGPVYFDRFGNKYTEYELQRETESATNHCTSGAFVLNFIGGFSTEEEETICQVFDDLTSELSLSGSGIVPVNIVREPLTYRHSAAATDFFRWDCGLAHSALLEILRTGANPLPSGVAAGIVHIRQVPRPTPGSGPLTWHTLDEDNTQMGCDPLCASEVDLYSVVLHEALHALGFASLIGRDGQGLNGLYSIWDMFLYSEDKAEHLIRPTGADPDCCSAQAFNEEKFEMPDDVDGHCENGIVFYGGSESIAPVSYANIVINTDNDMRNKLSHLERTCPSSGWPDFVMQPSILVGTTRRAITTPELKILCFLGYQDAPDCSVDCIVAANDDQAPAVIIRTGAGANNPLFIAFDDLLLNDIAPGDVTVELVEDCGDEGVELVVTEVTDGFSVNGTAPGIWTFCYTIKSCGGELCSQAEVTVIVRNSFVNIECEPGSCNLVSFGNFEDFFPGYNRYYNQLGLPTFSFLGASALDNSVDILQHDNNQVLRWVRYHSIGSRECPRIPLCEPVQPGCTLTIKYQASAGDESTPPPSPSPVLNIYGITASPCSQINEPTFQTGVFQICTGVNAVGISNNAGIQYYPGNTGINNLGQFEAIWTNNTTEIITDILLHGIFDGTVAGNYQYFVDDLSITSSCSPQVTITPTVLQQCIDGEAIIEFEICLDSPDEDPVTIDLAALLPGGFPLTVVSGGGFDSGGEAQVTLPDEDGDPNCVTLTLTLETGSNITPGAMATIGMGASSEKACVNTDESNGDAVLVFETCVSDTARCECPPLTNNYNIGMNENSVTHLDISGLPADLDGACLAINGKLVVNRNFLVKNSYVIMNRGAEIEVASGNYLELYSNFVEGCEHLWRSITVKSGGQLSAGDNEIADALYAIRAEDGARVGITQNTFDKNFVGIRVPPKANNALQTVTLIPKGIAFNKFICSDDLKPKYGSDSEPVPGDRTFAGVYLNNVAGLDIGRENVFEGIRNAVIAESSTFSLSESTIQDLIFEDQSGEPEPLNFNQIGVYAANCPDAKILENDILGVYIGVQAVKSNVVARTNTINATETQVNPPVGILVTDGTNQSTTIEQNTITTCGIGIFGQNFMPAWKMAINDNEVTLSDCNPSGYIGIELAQCRTGNIFSNTVRRGNPSEAQTDFGLLLTACEQIQVAGNTFYDMAYGVLTTSSMHCMYTANFAGSDPGGSGGVATNGFEAIASTGTYCCNEVDDVTGTGFSFQNTCYPTDFKWSHMTSTSQGLFLNPLGLIGPQEHKFNQWHSGSGGAYHASDDDLFIRKSQFKCASDLIPAFNTGAGAVDWFVFASGSPYSSPYPTCPLLACPAVLYPDPDDTATELAAIDTTVADVGFDVGEYFSPTYNWMTRQRLFERLKSAPGLTDEEEIIADFYTEADTGAMGQLYAVRKAIRDMIGRDAYTRHQLENAYGQLSDWADSLRVPYPDTFVDVTDSLLQINRRGVFAYRLKQEVLLYNAALTALGEARYESISGLLAANEEAGDDEVYMENERAVNDVLLSYALWTGARPDSAGLAALQAVAEQCPYLGGFPVWEARAYLRRYTGQTAWGDDANCAEPEERPSASVEHAQHAIKVYPNPANNRVVFADLPRTAAKQQIELYSLTGHPVAIVSVALGQNAVEINTGNLPTGLYLYQVRTEGQQTVTGKINIIH